MLGHWYRKDNLWEANLAVFLTHSFISYVQPTVSQLEHLAKPTSSPVLIFMIIISEDSRQQLI